jgi:hypothetical protein
MAITMLLLVFGDVFKRYIIPVVLITAFISLLSGLVAALAGGHFYPASLYAAIICGVIALIISLVVTFLVVFGRGSFV